MKILMRTSVRSGKRDAKGVMETYQMGQIVDLSEKEANRLISEQRAIVVPAKSGEKDSDKK